MIAPGYEDDGRPPPGYQQRLRPYSMSSAPGRFPPEVYYTSSEQPQLLVPGYRRQDYVPEEGPTTIIVENQMSDIPERPIRHRDRDGERERERRRRSRRGRHHDSDDYSRLEEAEEMMRKSKVKQDIQIGGPPADGWRSVTANPNPKPVCLFCRERSSLLLTLV
jgi:hypothetical protein